MGSDLASVEETSRCNAINPRTHTRDAANARGTRRNPRRDASGEITGAEATAAGYDQRVELSCGRKDVPGRELDAVAGGESLSVDADEDNLIRRIAAVSELGRRERIGAENVRRTDEIQRLEVGKSEDPDATWGHAP
jgi:hypothetical protein